MKTCPMCSTLLFDDAKRCTKCGNEVPSKEGSKGPTAGPPSTTPPATPPATSPATSPATPPTPKQITEPTETAEPEKPSTESITQTLTEATAQRKKWLEEQEKIKSELASIMGRVGRKKKPVQAQYIPTAAQPQMLAPKPQIGPVQNPSTLAPQPSRPNPTPQPSPAKINPAQPYPAVQPAQAPTPAPPAQKPALPVTGSTSAPVPVSKGLSETERSDLLEELNDLRNEGYNVTKLERIIEEDPGNAWKAFSDFLDEIENLNQQKERLESIYTEGLDDLENEKQNLLSSMSDPDYVSQYEQAVTKFENKVLATKSQIQQQAPPMDDAQKQEEEKLKKLMDLGKEAFRLKKYEKSMEFLTKAEQISPSNKEIIFFKKKVEAKLLEEAEEGVAGEAPQAAAGVGPRAEVKKKKKKKKKLVVSRPAPGVGAQGPIPGGAAPGQIATGTTQTKVQVPQAAGAQAAPQNIPPTQSVKSSPSPAQVQPKPQPVSTGAAQPGAGAKAAATDGPRTAAEFEALGFNAYINKDYPKALEFYKKVLEIDPNFPNVQNIINECLMRLGKK